MEMGDLMAVRCACPCHAYETLKRRGHDEAGALLVACYCMSDYSGQPGHRQAQYLVSHCLIRGRMEELLSWAGRTSVQAESSPLALSVGAC